LKAVILAGGLGTRLHPLTVDLPKPMVPLANRPLMSYIVELLAKHGFNDIRALLYHQPEVIKNYFGNGENFGVKIQYVEAPEDYGTAGAVKFACRDLREPVLVISADLITDFDLSQAVIFHRQKKALATVVLTRIENPLPYGIVITDKDSRIKSFFEKPSWSEVFSDTINAGIYVLEPKVLEYIPSEKAFDFSLDLFPLLLREKKPIFGYIADGYWKDIGQTEDYGRSHADVLRNRVKLKLLGQRLRENIWVGENVLISSSALLEGLGIIGDNSIVADEVRLSNTVIGRNCKIGRGAFLKECVIWDGVEVGSEAKLERAILGKGVKVGVRANLAEGVVVGDETEIGGDTDIRPFIKVWPRKVIEEGSTVSRSIIWREHWTKSIFGQYGVTGICNVEVTPQFAAALGAAFGSVLGRGTRISCSRDSHKASRMIHRALMAGVLSVGVNISNLEMVPIPINRFEIKFLKSQGGFHVRKSPFDPELLDLRFFDNKGMDLSSSFEKRVERRFFGEDFSRTTVEETGEVSFPFHRLAEEYKAGILEQLNLKAFPSSSFKLVIDYAFGTASQIFPSILGELGLEVVALDAYIDESKITKDKAAFEKSLHQMTKIVKSVGADLGVLLDTGAEKIFICDERGNIIDGRQALGIMALLVLKSRKNAAIAVPVSESKVIEELAHKYGGKVIRTKNNLKGVMEVAESGKVCFLGEGLGGFIFPEFMPAFDGMLSVCKLVECLSREKVKVSEICAETPPINLLSFEILCSSEQKGMVMRKAMDLAKDADRLETLDGLKFWHDGDWALILPDPSRPIIHLFAEANTKEKAQQLLNNYAKKINLIKEP